MPSKISEVDRDRIVKLFKEGVEPSLISNQLGLSKPTIYVLLQKEKLIEKRVNADFNDSLKKEAIELYKTGISYSAVSKAIKIPENTVKRFLKKQGLEGNFDQSTKMVGKTEELGLEFHNQGLTKEQIAHKLHISVGAVRNWYKKTKKTPNNRNYSSRIDRVKDIVIEHINLGYGSEEISRIIGISGTSLRPWLKKNGFELEKYKTRKHIEDRVKMLEYVRDFVSEERDLLVSQEYIDNVEHLTFKCPRNHLFTMSWFNYQKGHRCNRCSMLSSKPQEEILEYIKTIYNGEILYNTKSIIKPLELDIYIPEFRFAIEFNGLYWHSELHKNKHDHSNKYDLCRKEGIGLLAIYEDEWINKKDLVKSMIKRRVLNFGEKIRASDLEIKKLEKNIYFKEFFNKNHLDGHCKAIFAYGLYLEEKLICCASFKKNIKSGELEIARFASEDGFIIHGGLGKILKEIRGWYSGSIVSYSNNRLSHGNLYGKTGFKEITETFEPSYWYTDFKTRLFRTKCKRIRDPEVMEKFETEREQALGGVFSMRYLGHNKPLYRIYDYGHRKWII